MSSVCKCIGLFVCFDLLAFSLASLSTSFYSLLSCYGWCIVIVTKKKISFEGGKVNLFILVQTCDGSLNVNRILSVVSSSL